MSFPLLPKWSLLAVQGESVGPILGGEIVLRTGRFANLWASSEYRAELRVLLDLECFDDIPRSERAHGNLGLEWLHNDQIAPITRPRGWCNWRGHIGCYDHSVGPDATVAAIRDEWCRIAETWPRLDLRCQLYDREAGLCGPVPVVEFTVRDGKVNVLTDGLVPLELPETPLQTAERILAEQNMPRAVREQTCSPDTFYWALVNLRHLLDWPL